MVDTTCILQVLGVIISKLLSYIYYQKENVLCFSLYNFTSNVYMSTVFLNRLA